MKNRLGKVIFPDQFIGLLMGQTGVDDHRLFSFPGQIQQVLKNQMLQFFFHRDLEIQPYFAQGHGLIQMRLR